MLPLLCFRVRLGSTTEIWGQIKSLTYFSTTLFFSFPSPSYIVSTLSLRSVTRLDIFVLLWMWEQEFSTQTGSRSESKEAAEEQRGAGERMWSESSLKLQLTPAPLHLHTALCMHLHARTHARTHTEAVSQQRSHSTKLVLVWQKHALAVAFDAFIRTFAFLSGKNLVRHKWYNQLEPQTNLNNEPGRFGSCRRTGIIPVRLILL